MLSDNSEKHHFKNISIMGLGRNFSMIGTNQESQEGKEFAIILRVMKT
jgi:hypothetical protein